MNEMSSCAREEWPAIAMVIFRNYQWGAEKRNTTLWFDDNFVGTELDPELSYAKVADACGLKGVTVRTMEETTNAIKQSCEDQKNGITTFIEVILNQELGEPFRRDAMKKPVKVAIPGLGVNALPIIIPSKIAIRTVEIGLLGVPKISIAKRLFIPCENKQNTNANITPGIIVLKY